MHLLGFFGKVCVCTLVGGVGVAGATGQRPGRNWNGGLPLPTGLFMVPGKLSHCLSKELAHVSLN